MRRKAFLPLMLILPLLLVLTSPASAVPQSYDIYENYNRDNIATMQTWIYGTNWRAQTFTTIENVHTVENVRLWLHRVGNPTGNLTVSIRAVDEFEHPTSGPDLTVGSIAASSITTYWFGQAVDIKMENEINLDANTKYAIVMRVLEGDTDNAIYVHGFHTSPLYVGGDFCASPDSGASWTGYGGNDLIFEIWGSEELQWYEVGTWNSQINHTWYEVQTWTNYANMVEPPYVWGDDRNNWAYAKLLEISGDYPSGYTFRVFLEMTDNLEDHAMENFDDLRFVTFDNTGVYDHWVENKNDGENIIVWFKKSDTGQYCYLYYGNPDAPNWENGEATFEYFGAGESLSEWTQSIGTWTIENGVYQQTDNTVDAWQDGLKLNNPPTNTNRIVGMQLKSDSTNISQYWLNWEYQNRRIVEFSPNTPENYQVRIVLPFYDSTIIFYENIKAGALPHWIENYTDDNMTVWVRRLENNDSDIYVYYGDLQERVAEENGKNIFIFFDNFDGTEVDTDDWTAQSSGIGTVANGIYTAVGNAVGIYSNVNYDNTVIFQSLAKIAEANAGIIEWAVTATRPAAYFEYGDDVHRAITLNDPSSEDITALSKSANLWHVYEIRLPAYNEQRFYLDNELDVTHNNYTFNGSYPIGFRAYADAGGQVEVDWVLIRTFIDTEPTAIVGSEVVYSGDTFAAYSPKYSNPTNWLHTELRVGLATGFRGMSKVSELEGTAHELSADPIPDTWYRMTTKIYDDNVTIEIYHDNGDYETINFADDNWDQDWVEINLHTHYSEGSFDNIFIGKYIFPEPSIGLYSEENIIAAWYEVGTWTNYGDMEVRRPTLLAPENATTLSHDAPVFSWENGVNADSHWFVLDDDENFDSTVENLIVQTETYTPSSLSQGTYWWKVIAENATGTVESETWVFSIYRPLEVWGINGIGTFETAIANIPAKWIPRADWLAYHPSMWENVTQLSVPFGYMAAYWDTALTIYAGLYNENWMDNVIGQFNAYCWMIENFGYVPNVIYHDGPYVWSIGRSQPPYFMSVAWKIFTATDNTELLFQGYYWGKLELENFWSRTSLADKQGHDYDRPRYRPEYGLYVYDSGTDTGNLRRKLAAFESGLDDHARWDTPSENVWDVFPVGLNAMMYYNYQTLATMGSILNDRGFSIPGEEIQAWADNAENIKDSMNLYMWDAAENWYYDYNMNTEAQTGVEALDAAIVLYAEMVDNYNARKIADHLKANYLDGYVSPSTTTVEFNGVRPSFAEGRLWEYNRSLPPVKALVYEGLKKYSFVGYEDFDAYLGNVATGREGVNATTGAGEKGTEFPWGYVTTFLPPIQDKIGFTYDMRDNEIKFVPMSYIDNGMGGRFHIYDRMPIEVTFERIGYDNVSFDIDTNGQTFKLVLLLYFDLDTNIENYYVVKNGITLDASKYQFMDLDNDSENEGVLITDNVSGTFYSLTTVSGEPAGWQEVEIWTVYVDVGPPEWNVVAQWITYPHFTTWHEASRWFNYVTVSTWYEVGTWTYNANIYVPDIPDWWEVGTWTSYLNSVAPGWYEVGTWTNNLDVSEEGPPVPPTEQPSVWVTIIRILGIIGFFGWAGWKFKLVDDPVSGIEAGLTVVVAIIGIVIIWFVAEAIGAVAAAL